MVTINNSNLISGVFETLYDLLDANVTDPNAPPSRKWIFSTYPGNEIDTKSDFPIIIINPPNYTWQNFTITKKWAEYEVEIDIYSTKAEQADKLLDEILNVLETNRTALGADGIIKYKVIGTSSSTVKNGEIRVHIRTGTIQFKHIVLESR